MRALILSMFLSLCCSLDGQGDYIIEEQFRNEVVQTASLSQIQKGFEKIVSLEEQTIEDHIFLTEIEAPPFREEKRAMAFREMMAGLGMDTVWIDQEGSVLALKRGTMGSRTICLDAHLDTVFPAGTDVKVKVVNDTLFAPGIGDDTRGLAMMLTVARTITDLNIKTRDDILFTATVGEEGLGDLRGVKHLFRTDGPRIDSWIAIDGGEIGRVNIKGLGSYRYRVHFKGPGGHSWGAFGLANPHHALGDAINRFVELADDYTKSGPRTSYNVGVIGGGTSVNSIPFESIMEIDIRSVDPNRLDTMAQMLDKAVITALQNQNKRKRLGKDLSVDIIQIGNRPSGELSTELPLIQRALAATAYFGKRPRITRGSTNSNIPISLGIPAVTIGRGGVGANAHSLDEWWLNKEGYKSIQLAFLLLMAEAGVIE